MVSRATLELTEKAVIEHTVASDPSADSNPPKLISSLSGTATHIHVAQADRRLRSNEKKIIALVANQAFYIKRRDQEK